LLKVTTPYEANRNEVIHKQKPPPIFNLLKLLKETIMSNRKSSFAAIAATLLIAAASLNAHAVEADGFNGTPATANAAVRTIKVDSQTKWVNVQRGETVNFVGPNGSFAWTFDTLRPETNFNLAEIAPSSIKVQGVKVYVAKSPDDRG
jgi:hypothetical protein